MKKKKEPKHWGKVCVAERRRKDHIQCNRSRRWSGSSDGILGLEFDQAEK